MRVQQFRNGMELRMGIGNSLLFQEVEFYIPSPINSTPVFVI